MKIKQPTHPILEHKVPYKWYSIMIYRWKGERYFTVGNKRFETIKDAKAYLDTIPE